MAISGVCFKEQLIFGTRKVCILSRQMHFRLLYDNCRQDKYIFCKPPLLVMDINDLDINVDGLVSLQATSRLLASRRVNTAVEVYSGMCSRSTTE